MLIIKWSVCILHVRQLFGEPEWEQTAQTELAFTELCWSVSAPWLSLPRSCASCSLSSLYPSVSTSALLLLGPTAEKNHTQCMPCDDLCTCSVSDCLIHNVWSTCGKSTVQSIRTQEHLWNDVGIDRYITEDTVWSVWDLLYWTTVDYVNVALFINNHCVVVIILYYYTVDSSYCQLTQRTLSGC